MKKRNIILGVAVLAGLMLAAGTQLHGREASAGAFPDIIPLPDGWQPEGIATGRGPVIYSGSRVNGGIYEASLRTGEGRILVPPQEGRVAIGLAFDKRTGYIFAAGGGGGAAYVYDSATGATVAEYALPVCGPTFINDVVITRNAAYFTDSQCPQIYRVPLGPGGSLPSPGNVEVIPLSGDYEHVAGFNANGIEATPNGSALIIVQSNTGLLFEVEPSTGIATEIDLGGALMTNGDGILLEGNTLYVVRNRDNIVAEIRLAPDLLSGTVIAEHSSAAFDVPTTIAAHGSRLYVVNARFGVADPDSAEYDIVRVP